MGKRDGEKKGSCAGGGKICVLKSDTREGKKDDAASGELMG